jgi:hypothetical protein
MPAIAQGIKENLFSQPDYSAIGAFSVVSGNVVLANVGHIFGHNGLKVKDLTHTLTMGRRLAQEYGAFFRSKVPGFEKADVIATASIPGVRETRRIVGEYMLSVGDFKARRSFDDEIGRCAYEVDVHPSTVKKEELDAFVVEYSEKYRLKPGESYGIPYRCLIPKESGNLLVAGRCISADRKTQGSTRVMPYCFITGQAAGTALSLCLDAGKAPRDLDSRSLREALVKSGAYLPNNA